LNSEKVQPDCLCPLRGNFPYSSSDEFSREQGGARMSKYENKSRQNVITNGETQMALPEGLPRPMTVCQEASLLLEEQASIMMTGVE
jgi:hypothetical protein